MKQIKPQSDNAIAILSIVIIVSAVMLYIKDMRNPNSHTNQYSRNNQEVTGTYVQAAQ